MKHRNSSLFLVCDAFNGNGHCSVAGHFSYGVFVYSKRWSNGVPYDFSNRSASEKIDIQKFGHHLYFIVVLHISELFTLFRLSSG